MKKILVNDGIHPDGKAMMVDAGFEVITDHIPQDELPNRIDEFSAVLVRSATKIRTELIDKASKLEVIGRGGVGLDNIDVDYAKSKNIQVVNTPAASSRSVAELVFAHLFSIVRDLPNINREFVKAPNENFKPLKKGASNGVELFGKTLGVIGGGRIGRETASIALGAGMNVLVHDPFIENVTLEVNLHPSLNKNNISVELPSVSLDHLLTNSDFITLHIPGGKVVLDEAEFSKMKDGVGLVNCARGGVVSEQALHAAITSGKVAFAGIDVFESEPPTDHTLFGHQHVSFSPHIGASTKEAQVRVGTELAQQIIDILK